jgi:hypothetical protein
MKLPAGSLKVKTPVKWRKICMTVSSNQKLSKAQKNALLNQFKQIVEAGELKPKTDKKP